MEVLVLLLNDGTVRCDPSIADDAENFSVSCYRHIYNDHLYLNLALLSQEGSFEAPCYWRQCACVCGTP